MKLNCLRVVACAVVLLVGAACKTPPGGNHPVFVSPGKDTIVSRYERPVEQIFAAAKEVLRFNGTLYGENTIAHTLEAKVDTRTVWVQVEEVEPKTSQVKVMARTKARMADIDLAAEI